MRLNVARTTAVPLWQPAPETDKAHHGASRSELGRRAILLGWLVTMLGIVGYIVAMSRAGESAGILDALTGQGPLGWISGALMLGGVVVWFIGNLASLQALTDIPGESGE